jgi:hypothetical protein
MKFAKILFVLLLATFWTTAQNEKGSFFAETGVKLFGGGDYINFIGKPGISFNKTNSIYYHPNSSSEYQHSIFSWSVAPRIGYQLFNSVGVGLDFQAFGYSMKDYSKYQNSSVGVFIRKEFEINRILPFIEFSGGLGRSNEKTNDIAPSGGEYTTTRISDLHYFSAATGISVFIKENFKVSVSAKIQNTIEKDSKKPDSMANDYKFSHIELGPMLSVAYIFKRNKSNKK